MTKVVDTFFLGFNFLEMNDKIGLERLLMPVIAAL